MDRICKLIDDKTIRLERLFPRPIEDVWTYLVDPNKRAKWLCGGDWDLKPGGRASLIFDNASLSEPGDGPPSHYASEVGEIHMAGEVVSFDPPRQLVLIWFERTGDGSRVTFDLEPVGDATKLIITHTDIPNIEHVQGASAGWHAHTDIWQAVVERRTPPSFWRRFIELEREYKNVGAMGRTSSS